MAAIKTRDPSSVIQTGKNVLNVSLATAKASYVRDVISDNKRNNKELHKLMGKLLNKQKVKHLPTHGSELELADRFAVFYSDKVVKLRQDIESRMSYQCL